MRSLLFRRFEAERIQGLFGERLSFVVNQRFEDTSSLYSLWLAKEHLLDGVCGAELRRAVSS